MPWPRTQSFGLFWNPYKSVT